MENLPATVPELPGRVFPAKIVRTSGVVDAQSRTLLVELELDNSRGEIFAGSYAQVRFPEAKLDRVAAARRVPVLTEVARLENVSTL